MKWDILENRSTTTMMTGLWQPRDKVHAHMLLVWNGQWYIKPRLMLCPFIDLTIPESINHGMHISSHLRPIESISYNIISLVITEMTS